MKTQLTFLVLLISIISVAQNGINYKALIKDATGNVISNQEIDVVFTIKIDNESVYSESQQVFTDSNGIAIAVIGVGSIISGDFMSIDWKRRNAELNVQIDLGEGLVDFGNTPFNTVPYAIHALNTEGLEAIDEGNGSGFRLVGRDPTHVGNIGLHALDLSYSSLESTSRGATGFVSVAMGANTTASNQGTTAMGSGSVASGFNSTAMGSSTSASGINSTAMGDITNAVGSYSTAMGRRTNAEAAFSTAIGRYNIGGGNTESWIETDPLFEIGTGSGTVRANALTVLKNGNLGLGTHTPQELLHITGGRLRIGSETIEDGGTDILAFSSSLVPTVDEDDRLGGPNRKWLDVYAVNGTIQTSDRRNKTNIANLNYGLAEVLKMQPVSFNWKNKNNPDTKIGLIAQDLQILVPEVVHTHIWEKDEESGTLTKKELDRLGVYYSDLVPVLINAIKEQNKIIESQGAALKTSKDNYEALLTRIEMLESKSSN